MMSINFEILPPIRLLDRYKVNISSDTTFRSWCRLKQSIYRESQNWECGIGGRDKNKIGNYLTSKLGDQGKNFLSKNIFEGAITRLKHREPKDVIHKDRLLRNMLTSQTLCFNLFIPQMLDPNVASIICKTLLPDCVNEITEVKLEHSPARGHEIIGTGDCSAFDAYLEYVHIDGSKGIIVIETKYTESFSQPFGSPSSRHEEIVKSSHIYTDVGWRRLQSMKTQQLWRTHLLAESMRKSDVKHITYLVLYAEGDRECAQLIGEYRDSLNNQLRQEELFISMTLENVLATLRSNDIPKNMSWLNLFYKRYLDWSPVEQLL